MFALLDVAKDAEVEVFVAIKEDAASSEDSCNKRASSGGDCGVTVCESP